MARDLNTDAPELRAVGSEMGLSIGGALADEFVRPVRTILESMDPLVPAPDPPGGVPTVEVAEGDDPHNAFVVQCDVRRDAAGGPLAGRTVALKDNIALAGLPLTVGSGMLEGHVPSRSAPVADRLLDAGATIVGKANMDEFAFGPTGETSYFGPTSNPSDPEYTPGGSSSGSAAAVASGAADLALGTDTGGSVRIPASHCGVLGLKPTQGLIPTHGVVELAGSLDTVGILGTGVDDVAECLSVLSDDGSGGRDVAAMDPDDVVLGVSASSFESPVRGDVAERLESVVDRLVDSGATRRSVTLPSTTFSSPVWRAITMAELYRYFTGDGLPYRRAGGRKPPFSAAFRGARRADVDRLSKPLKQYLLIGGYLVTRDAGRRYGNALAVREQLRERVEAALADVDMLVGPATPTTAFAFGEFSRDSSPSINNNTHLFNLTGHPAVSVPGGDVDGLPIGVQIVGARGADVDVLRLAKTVQENVA